MQARTPDECANHMIVRYGTSNAPKHVADAIQNNRDNSQALLYWQAVDRALILLLRDV